MEHASPFACVSSPLSVPLMNKYETFKIKDKFTPLKLKISTRWKKSRVPKSPVPTKYLDKFQIILKTYELGLRFKEKTAGMLQQEELELLSSRKTKKKHKIIQGGGDYARRWAKALGRVTPRQESPVPEKQELHQSSQT